MTEKPRFDLLIGTSNLGKASEIQLALQGLALVFRDIGEFPKVVAPEETGLSYLENAIIKAKAYAIQTGVPALADDSGLEVDALNGAPGLHSARLGGNGISDAERTKLLLSKLSSVEAANRQARFICAVAIAEPTDGILSTAQGACSGTIAHVPSGDAGFGFDPIFVPRGYDLTFGQLPASIKREISHRAKALALTAQFLAHYLA